MKRIIILLVLIVCSSVSSAYAQQQLVSPSKTSVTDGRFEILIGSYNTHILLDKHEGRVWRIYYYNYNPIPVEFHDEQLLKIDTTQINYQVYVLGVDEFFLVNIHSGETWKYDSKKIRFAKIITP